MKFVEMHQYFYATILIAAMLLGIISLASSVIGKRPAKIWRYIMNGLIVITFVALAGFGLTVSI